MTRQSPTDCFHSQGLPRSPLHGMAQASLSTGSLSYLIHVHRARNDGNLIIIQRFTGNWVCASVVRYYLNIVPAQPLRIQFPHNMFDKLRVEHQSFRIFL